VGPAADDLGLEVLGPEFRESELCGEAVFFDGLYSSPECIQGKGPDLISVGQAIALAGQLLKAGFRLLDPGICLG
jgi:hypothetical protein